MNTLHEETLNTEQMMNIDKSTKTIIWIGFKTVWGLDKTVI